MTKYYLLFAILILPMPNAKADAILEGTYSIYADMLGQGCDPAVKVSTEMIEGNSGLVKTMKLVRVSNGAIIERFVIADDFESDTPFGHDLAVKKVEERYASRITYSYIMGIRVGRSGTEISLSDDDRYLTVFRYDGIIKNASRPANPNVSGSRSECVYRRD